MQIYSVLVLAMLLSSVPALALEFKFRPSYLELHDEGIVQRVMPGELVEVPMGESAALEIETSPNTPREVRIKSKGESEFVIFGATSKLQDGGIMTASMDQETRKLDISWTRGEMKTPPQDFDKPAAVAFFTSQDEDLLRPLEFAGIRPFGYTDEIEGRKPWTEKTLADLPPLGLPPPVQQGESEPLPQEWITFEDDSSSPEPLSIPAPLPLNKKRSTPSQLVFLEPSSATLPTPNSEKPSSEEKGKSADLNKSDSLPSAEGEMNKLDSGGEKSDNSKLPSSSPITPTNQAEEGEENSDAASKTEKEPADSKKAPNPSDPKKAPNPSDPKKAPNPSDSKKAPNPSDPKKAPNPSDSKKAPNPSDSKKEVAPVTQPDAEGMEGSEKPPQKKTKPTLYEIVMEQERRQEEVLKMIADVSNQVKILKEKPLTTPPAQSEPTSESKPVKVLPAAVASKSTTSPLPLGNSVTSPAPAQALSVAQESPPAPAQALSGAQESAPAPAQALSVAQESAPTQPEVLGGSVDFEVEIVTDDSITVGGE